MASSYSPGTTGIGPFADPNLYSQAISPVGNVDGRDYNFAGEWTGGNGAVLGANTGGGQAPVQQQIPTQQQNVDPYSGIRDEISGGWDSYLASLDQQLGQLPGQRASQEQIVQNQYGQSSGNLNTQRNISIKDLDTEGGKIQSNQVKTLRDLSSNISNSMRAGNIYLGSQGAGDSSAANQYAYALTKLGSRERSNVMQNSAGLMADVESRKWKIGEIYNQESRNLQSDRDNKLLEVSQWFSQAQSQIQQAKAQGQLDKSQDLASLSKDLLNFGMQAISQVDTSFNNQMQLLGQWSQGKTQEVAQTLSQLQGQSQTNYQLPQAGQVAGTPRISGGNMFTPTFGGGYATEEKESNNIFS